MFSQHPPPNTGLIREISIVIFPEGHQVQYISALNAGNLILKLISHEISANFSTSSSLKPSSHDAKHAIFQY